MNRNRMKWSEDMKIGVYPGSFDPITFGHLDIVERSARLFDKLYIGVLNNSAKHPMFTVEERTELIKKVTQHIPNVEVGSFDGLLVEYADEIGADAIVRGLRAVTDFEYEIQIAQMNHELNPEIDTIYLTTSTQYAYLSSSIVKEIATYHGDVTKFVPEAVAYKLKEKANKR